MLSQWAKTRCIFQEVKDENNFNLSYIEFLKCDKGTEWGLVENET